MDLIEWLNYSSEHEVDEDFVEFRCKNCNHLHIINLPSNRNIFNEQAAGPRA